MPNNSDAEQSIVATQAELAEYLGIPEDEIPQLVKAGIFRDSGPKAGFDLERCLYSYIVYLRARGIGRSPR